jgi:flagellar motility protein MotE (MotC chaperone)
MESKIDIADLVDKNPLVTLTKQYKNKLVERIKEAFTSYEQQLFVASFYCFLKTSDEQFVIDLDSIWKWLGYSAKTKAKYLLLKYFIAEKDFVTLTAEPKAAGGGSGGANKETILMTVTTFKKMCLKSNTSKANEIHDYYVKLENLLLHLVSEQTDELTKEIEEKETLLQETEEELKREQKKRNKLLNRHFQDSKKGDVVYLYKGNKEGGKTLYKIGKTKNIKQRETSYSNDSKAGEIILIKYCNNCHVTEKAIHQMLHKYRVLSNQEWFDVPEDVAIEYVKLAVDMIDSPDVMGKVDNDQVNDEKLADEEKECDDLLLALNAPPAEAPPPLVQNSKDFAKFFEDCCEMGEEEEYFTPKADLRDAHRVWCGGAPTKEVSKAFNAHLLENFTNSVIYIDDVKRNCVRGMRLKPRTFTPTLGKDYETFLVDKCKFDSRYRIAFVDFYNLFEAWKQEQESDAEYHLDKNYRKEIKNYLETHFAAGRVHTSETASSKHLFGVWGVGVASNNYGLKDPKRVNKQVEMVDSSSLEVLKTWPSLCHAQRDTGIALSTLSGYARFKTDLCGHFYRYTD